MRASFRPASLAASIFCICMPLACGQDDDTCPSPPCGTGSTGTGSGAHAGSSTGGGDPSGGSSATGGSANGTGGTSGSGGGAAGGGASGGTSGGPSAGGTGSGGASGVGGAGAQAGSGGQEGTGGQTMVDPVALEQCRGAIAVPSQNGIYVGWRFKATDPASLAFHVYRDQTRLTATPVVDSTNWLDPDGNPGDVYEIRPVLDGAEQAGTNVTALAQPYLQIPLQNPEGKAGRLVGTADLDGDCDFDFVVKLGNQDHDVTTVSADNDTFTLEAYTQEGDFLWSRDLGPNVSPGVWFSPITVFDFDGDGKAEVALKTVDGEVNFRDGATGDVPLHQHADSEFLEIWDGQTGATRARTPWISVTPWGSDGYRYNRNMIAPAYLGGDGENPSVVITRGGNSRNEIHAYDLVGSELVERWVFVIGNGGGNYGHNVRVGDIDADGKDEFLFFGRALDDDGKEMWVTNEAHGDRFHLTDLDPSRPGLEIFYVQEFGDTYMHPVHVRAAEDGSLLWGPEGDWGDVGRGLSANIDPTPGIESWASQGDLYSAQGQSLGTRPSSVNMAIWWDADLQRELIDGTTISKPGAGNLLSAAGCGSGSRNIPMGYGDVLGDWREEAWWLCSDNTELRVYIPTAISSTRMYGLMQDPIYRTSVGCMMMGYVQSTQTTFYIGSDMDPPPLPYVTIPAGR